MSSLIPLEDEYADILLKAMRGRRVAELELSARTGLPPDLLSRLCRGEFCDEPALLKIATVLSLDPQALTIAAARAWRPRLHQVAGLEMFRLGWRRLWVNAYLVYDSSSGEAAFFDTGTDSVPLVKRVAQLGLTVRYVFLTHTHSDHVAALGELRSAFPQARVLCNRAEPWPNTELFTDGDSFSLGSLSVTPRTTSGHSVGGTTYIVDGLSTPLAMVGDALFAGSMGGGLISFDDAWRNNREKILTLSDETIICPGHGPLTSVGEEKRHNPFFAAEFR